MQPIGVIGLGVVGGALREALSSSGYDVRGYDPYQSEGDAQRLASCPVVFVCVNTPSAEAGGLDTSAVWKAIWDVEAVLSSGTVVAVKSTVPPGTSRALSADFPRFTFASVPEFLVASDPLGTLTKPDRVLIGTESDHARHVLAGVMLAIAPGAPQLLLSPIEAELAKLCANAMLAAKISMANELALVCDRFDVSWSSVQAAVGLDHRIGGGHLAVTDERGFGGGCLPKDLDGLIAAATEAGHDPTLLAGMSRFNRSIRREAKVGDR